MGSTSVRSVNNMTIPLEKTLSPQQEKILTLVAKGLSEKKIARRISLSPATVNG